AFYARAQPLWPLQSTHAGTRVLPLQAVGGSRRSARLLDNHRNGADRGLIRGLARGVGADSGDRRRIRRAADLRVGNGDHVLAQVVLLLRAPATEPSAAVRVPWPRRPLVPGPARRADVGGEGREHRSHHASRSGGSATHGLAARSVRVAGQTYG